MEANKEMGELFNRLRMDVLITVCEGKNAWGFELDINDGRIVLAKQIAPPE